MSEEEQKYFKGLIGFTFDTDDIKYIEKIVDKKDKEIERLKEELEFEKATNKELISTGADLENKLYEEQDKNKRLNKRIEDLNIINEEHQILNGMIRKELQQKENIIKEVREYIEKYTDNTNFLEVPSKELLEILDRGSDKE